MAGSYNGVAVPADGQKIGYANGKYDIPDNPIIPFIEGDGTGRDIWKASVRVFDAAVEKAYKGKRRVAWYEVFAGEKAKAKFNNWLPEDTVNAIREFRVAIKGPLTTPVGGGIRSLNVALRQILDLYCLHAPGEVLQGRAVAGEASRAHEHRHLPRKHRRRLRRNRMGAGNARSCARLIEFLNKDMLKGGKKQIRLDSGVGIKPISVTGTKRLVRMAIQHALENKLQDRDPGPQRQHPEVHRRRVPQVGIRTRHRRIPRPGRHRARELDPRQQRQEPEHHRRRKCRPGRTRPGIRSARLPPSGRERSEAQFSTPSTPPTAKAHGRRS